jgi:hypothetical protein
VLLNVGRIATITINTVEYPRNCRFIASLSLELVKIQYIVIKIAYIKNLYLKKVANYDDVSKRLFSTEYASSLGVCVSGSCCVYKVYPQR